MLIALLTLVACSILPIHQTLSNWDQVLIQLGSVDGKDEHFFSSFKLASSSFIVSQPPTGSSLGI